MECALWMCHKEGTEKGNTFWSGDCTPTKAWSSSVDVLLNDEETEVQKGDPACHTHLLVLREKAEYNIYSHIHIMFLSHPTL